MKGVVSLNTEKYKDALSWFSKASDQGHTASQHHLGCMYENGGGVDKDFTKALDRYTVAGKNGHSGSFNNIGYLYYYSEGVERDYEKAFIYFTKSANKGFGSGTAENWLGLLYYRGHGVEINYCKAFNWFKKSVDDGHDGALVNLGNAYRTGTGTPQNGPEAVRIFKKAASKGSPY